MRSSLKFVAKLLVIELALILTFTYRSLAQTPPTWCVKSYLATKSKGTGTLGIEPSEAEKLVQDVANSIGLGGGVKIVECFDKIKAVAWSPGSDFPGIPDDEYIIYNPDWVREVIGSDRVQAIALFGHEFGHLANRHFGARKSLSLVEKETEADRFAGCAVARLHGDMSALENLLSRLRREKDEMYPNRLKSLDAARQGFASCSKDKKFIQEKECRLPEHGIERWGLERVVERSSGWRGGGTDPDRFCDELMSSLRREYPQALEFDKLSTNERSRDNCQPFRCIQYNYMCKIQVKGDPIYIRRKSDKCSTIEPTSVSTICKFTSGPRLGQKQDYAPMAALPLGTPCHDALGSVGVIVASDGDDGTAQKSRYPEGRSTICKFTFGPRAGQSQNFALMSPQPIGIPCQDGFGSTGTVVQ